ncbi:unnamed protein product [Clavelina lepadiformis]|uniref:Carbohydrate sulfotransferase n=1 Tax=Clavelina lepadiformis TaxID=159417 RepID=A0ABP0F8V9_CLALP
MFPHGLALKYLPLFRPIMRTVECIYRKVKWRFGLALLLTCLMVTKIFYAARSDDQKFNALVPYRLRDHKTIISNRRKTLSADSIESLQNRFWHKKRNNSIHQLQSLTLPAYLTSSLYQVDLIMPNASQREGFQPEVSKTYNNRKELLNKVCKKKTKVRLIWNDNIQLIAAPQQRLVVCFVQKAGSTSWHKLVFNLTRNQHETSWGPKGHAENRVFTRKLPNAMKETLMLSPQATRVISIRHPFARLVSGWNNKFGKKFVSRSGNVMFETMPDLRNYVGLTAQPDENHIISFEDFVQYIADKGLNEVDIHFKAIEELCQPCDFPYDYVVKAETTINDLWWVLQRINATMEGFSSHQIVTKTKKDDRKMIPTTNDLLETGWPIQQIKESIYYLFRRVPRKTIRKLMSLYCKDFLNFGYTFNVDTLEAGGFE